jgi:hypothetical protein
MCSGPTAKSRIYEPSKDNILLVVHDANRLVGKTWLILVIFQGQLQQFRIDLAGLRIGAERAAEEENVRLRTVCAAK